ARFALEEFLFESLRAGFSCVRVIHGRGRHSHKHHPILKENVQRWLCTRRMSRHVIAYSSARRCDGGGGAVSVPYSRFTSLAAAHSEARKCERVLRSSERR